MFNDNKTSEQVVNVQPDESPKMRYIPLTFNDDRRDDAEVRQSGGRATPLMEARIVPAMTDDSPIVEEEDLDLSKEDIR